MKRALTLLLLLCFVIPAFGQDRPADANQKAPPETAEALTIKSAEPTHIAGVFNYEGTKIVFDSRRSNNNVAFELSGADGQPVLRAQSDGNRYRVSYLAGRASIEGRLSSEAMPPPKPTGEPGVIDELIRRPEYRALPHLSRALAERQIWGTSHPASLYLHGLALAAATRLKIEIRPLSQTSATTQCKDQRSTPCKNDCFGMCGKGCNCWNWVCGDCCARKGCLAHDITCRRCDCSVSNVADCALCYSAVSFLGPNPCASVAEECPVPPQC